MKDFFIPSRNLVGGPKTFLDNLRFFLDKHCIKYYSNFNETHNIFFPISFDLKKLDLLKKNNNKIIQRLDGIYYREKHGEKFKENNRDIQKIYENYADFVVFQSNYSLKQCFSLFGKKKENEIITNGANLNIFFPEFKRKKYYLKLRFITTGRFRNIDMIEPLVKALDDIYKINKNIEFIVVGEIINKKLQHFFDRVYIKYLGKCNMMEIAELLRKSDIFLYSHLNPPCPNSVIEAISSGLPVVSFNSGAMIELLDFSKELLAEVSPDIFQKYDQFDYKKLVDKIEFCIDNYELFKEKSINNWKNFDFEKCGSSYLSLFRRVYI